MTGLRGAIRDLPDAVFADFLESDEAYRLIFDLPGVRAETVDVDVRRQVLHVDARREKDVPEGFRYRREDRPLFVEFDVPLPPDAEGEEAAATIEAGVLDVTVPKTGAPGVHVPVEG